MPPSLRELGLDKLSIEDRLAVAEAILESVALETDDIMLSVELRAELERRLADSIARPDAVISWTEVKARALSRRKEVRNEDSHL